MNGKLMLLVIGLTFSKAASANAYIPMLSIAWPFYWWALVPVSILESELGIRWLSLPRKRVYFIALVANVLSTLVGIPIAWVVMVWVQIAAVLILILGSLVGVVSSNSIEYIVWHPPVSSAWLIIDDNPWTAYVSFVVLAVPFCWVSIVVELLAVKRLIVEVSDRLLRQWIKRANIISYSILVLVASIFPIIGRYINT